MTARMIGQLLPINELALDVSSAKSRLTRKKAARRALIHMSDGLLRQIVVVKSPLLMMLPEKYFLYRKGMQRSSYIRYS